MVAPVPRQVRFARLFLVTLAIFLGGALATRGDCACGTPRNLDDLQALSIDRLRELYIRSEMGTPLVGVANGRLLCLTDRCLPRLKVRMANSVWRGKAACEDGAFLNRWVGNIRVIGSTYVIGPSWIDGKPTVIMEYAPGTALFANMHDELREVAPGLYLGPVYERFPCPKFRGYLGLQLECSNRHQSCGS